MQRRDTGETVVFVDRVYFEGEKDVGAEKDIEEQARQLAESVRVPLYMAKNEMPDAEMVEQLRYFPFSEQHLPYTVHRVYLQRIFQFSLHACPPTPFVLRGLCQTHPQALFSMLWQRACKTDLVPRITQIEQQALDDRFDPTRDRIPRHAHLAS